MHKQSEKTSYYFNISVSENKYTSWPNIISVMGLELLYKIDGHMMQFQHLRRSLGRFFSFNHSNMTFEMDRKRA